MNDGWLFLLFFLVILLGLLVGGLFPALRGVRTRDLVRKALFAVNSREYRETIRLCDEILTSSPRFSWAYTARGACRLQLGEYEHAIHDCTLAIEIDQTHAEDFVNRARAYQATRQFDKAIADYTSALSIKPDDSEALVRRGQCRQDLGDHTAAAGDFAQVVAKNTDVPGATFARGLAYAALEQHQEAIEELSIAIRNQPENIEAYSYRSYALYKDGQHRSAIADAKQVVCALPEYSYAINLIAWIQSTSPDADVRNGKDAVANAKHACELSEFKVWEFLGTLAAAHAEVGEFEDAVRWAKKALELAPEEMRARVEETIQLYCQKKPWREPAETVNGSHCT